MQSLAIRLIAAVLALCCCTAPTGAQQSGGNPHIFQTDSIREARLLPALGNGHLGYVPYGDTVHLNNLFSGPLNNTRRSRLPNYGRVQYEFCGPYSLGAENCHFSFDARRALFRTHSVHPARQFEVELLSYPHRIYHHAIVNHLLITRTDPANTTEAVRVRLFASPGSNSADFTLRPDVAGEYNGIAYTAYSQHRNGDPSNSTVIHARVQHVPETVTLPAGQTELTYTWVATIGSDPLTVATHFERSITSGGAGLLALHLNEWQKFWSQSGIEIEGNDQLARTIYAGLYTVAASQLAPGSITAAIRPEGVSPEGLGRNDFGGLSTVDSELWVAPVALLLEQKWSQELVGYRVKRHEQAVRNAERQGYRGALFPLQSGPQNGVELSNDAELAATKHHVTGDVAFAVRQHFLATLDGQWLRTSDVCAVAVDTARFWDERAQLNAATERFDLNGTTGPNGAAFNVSNNAYTNVVAAANLFFGQFAACHCGVPVRSAHGERFNYYTVARSLALAYRADGDFTPEHGGYSNAGGLVDAADTVLLSYPLNYALAEQTQLTNLRLYEASLSDKAPSTTYAVHNVIRLGLGSQPSEAQFNRTWQPYVQGPFHVWAESAAPDARQPRLTAAAAFLQQILNGYAGIRLHEDRLQISRAALPPLASSLKLNGFQYLNGSYSLEINATNIKLTVKKHDANTAIEINDVLLPDSVSEFTVNATNATIILRPKEFDFGSCHFETSTIGHRSSAASVAISAIAFILIAVNLI